MYRPTIIGPRTCTIMDLVFDVCVREPIMNPVLDVCVREPIMDPVLDVCVREPIMDLVFDVCVREPIMDPVLDVACIRPTITGPRTYEIPRRAAANAYLHANIIYLFYAFLITTVADQPQFNLDQQNLIFRITSYIHILNALMYVRSLRVDQHKPFRHPLMVSVCDRE